MDIKFLNTFRTIVAEGSFSKAAKKLNYTQSSITFQIGRLEDELSTRLFEKLGRNMILTKAGEQLVPYVDDVFASLDKMKSFESDLKRYQGDIHIGIGESLLCYQLPAILKAFHQQAPKARLFIKSMNCYQIRDALLNGTLDLGLFYKEIGGLSSNLTIHPFGTYDIALVASPSNKSQNLDFKTPNQHISLPLVINEPDCLYRQLFEKYLTDKSISMAYTIELWSIPTIKNLVTSNIGASILPRFAVAEELENGQLEEIKTDMSPLAISAVCGYHKNKWLSPPMELFISLCQESV